MHNIVTSSFYLQFLKKLFASWSLLIVALVLDLGKRLSVKYQNGDHFQFYHKPFMEGLGPPADQS